ncbi:MAG: inositol monophosphatase family protein [Nitrospira sp.]|nr:inositol monophosphatase [Candidatus Manganitrophaceae bacterium]HIL35208.1 inositol monophosphatase [Candidatus Manganitrophaceae bacterium]
MVDLEAFKKIAVQAAKRGGKILKAGLQQEITVSYKEALEIVTNIDTRSEKAIVTLISRYFPDHQIMAEEGSGRESRSPYKWIIDPLDGTTNFSHRFPFFCVSIALEVKGRVCLGVIYDPVRRELFSAEKGKGAFLNGLPIQISSVKGLKQSLLVTGFSYDIQTDPENTFNHFINFTLNAQAVRRTGSAALDLCYVAAGRFDGFWETKLRPWDIAAGSLILREAGGRITDFTGGAYSIYEDEILATNRKIHKEMIEILKKKKT